MSSLSLTKNAVLAAMQVFDQELRGSVEWEHWRANKAHKYAIQHDELLYPVKKVASIASGIPVGDFSGGRSPGQANKLVQLLGFRVIDLHPTNPDWSRDELIVALSFYLRHLHSLPAKGSAEITELSTQVNRLGMKLFTALNMAETFRNENGVYMKLMNFRRVDPQYTAEGRVGLSRGAKAELEVWNEFSNKPELCQLVATSIIASLDDPDVESGVAFDAELSLGVQEAPEGRLLTRKHLVRERNRTLVTSKLNSALKRTGVLACEVCGFDFSKRYGVRGNGFIECHHTKPVATLSEGHKTHIDDLALVCANCHRIIHRGKPWLSISALRSILKDSRV